MWGLRVTLLLNYWLLSCECGVRFTLVVHVRLDVLPDLILLRRKGFRVTFVIHVLLSYCECGVRFTFVVPVSLDLRVDLVSLFVSAQGYLAHRKHSTP